MMLVRYVLCLLLAGLTIALMPVQDELAESRKRGAVLYEGYCISCHMGAGEGVPGVYPPLAKSDYLMKHPEKAVQAVKYGLQGAIMVNGQRYQNYMAAQGLTDQEVADVLNYVMGNWGNKSRSMMTAAYVGAIPKP
ncbi:MAG: cytochrome c [Bacteroidia bacterium]|jgi:mono/diheme cytochrome c family protein|nr:cytochrome c [Bacteroidia bacterium]